LVLTRALGNPKETDSNRLSSLGSALAALAAKFDSGRQTQLVALSNLFLGKVSPRSGRSPEEQAQDRKRIVTVCASLSAKELAGVLKWPFCVGETQELVFAEFKKKIGRPFEGSLSKFVEQVDSLSIDGVDQKFLNQPALRPKAEPPQTDGGER
jgi:hypothetical protein